MADLSPGEVIGTPGFYRAHPKGMHQRAGGGSRDCSIVHFIVFCHAAASNMTDGEYFSKPGPDAETSFGGTITGHSVPRIAGLKKTLEEGLPDGWNRIHPDYEPTVAGQAGAYDLSCLWHETPTNWIFRLYKRGLTDSMKFPVDVTGTWDITITLVPGEFVIRKKNGYSFVNAEGWCVWLPGRAYLALRVQRVDKR